MRTSFRTLAQMSLILVLSSSQNWAQDLDPKTRSEDISGSTIAVDISRNESGHYVYDYTFTNGTFSESAIGAFQLHIQCERVDESEFDPAGYVAGQDVMAPAGSYSPVAVVTPSGEAAMWGISFDGFAWWAVNNAPGVQGTVRLISPFPPKERTYDLVPSWGQNYDLYDYSEVKDDQEDIPWIDDFTVTGMIKGPGCTSIQEPPDPENGAFAGTQKGKESNEENALLTYSAPLRSQFAVPAGAKTIEFVVHYAPNIDPDSFKAKINSIKWDEVEALFRVDPGTHQIVSIPLGNHNYLKVKIEVSGLCGDGGEGGSDCVQAVDGSKSKASLKDKDEFKIRQEI